MNKHLIRRDISIIIITWIIICTLWISLYNIITTPKESEVIDYFITCSNIDKDYLINKTNEVLDDTYKKINIVYNNESNTYYDAMLQANGIIDADILIVKCSLFDNETASTGFIPLSEDIFSDCSFVDINDVHYGIIIKNKDIDIFKNFITYYDDNESYCICINNSSTKQSQAINIVLNLLKK